jgi:hypothetical protein
MQVAIATGLLTALPALGVAQSSAGTPSPPSTTFDRAPADTSHAPKTPNVRVHATKGVVKSVDENNLVITRSQHGRDMSFVLNPSTERYGDVKVASTVDVRYRTEAEQRIAIAVTVEHARQPPSAAGSHQY